MSIFFLLSFLPFRRERMTLSQKRPDIIVRHRIVERDRNPVTLIHMIRRIAAIMRRDASSGIAHFDIEQFDVPFPARDNFLPMRWE